VIPVWVAIAPGAKQMLLSILETPSVSCRFGHLGGDSQFQTPRCWRPERCLLCLLCSWLRGALDDSRPVKRSPALLVSIFLLVVLNVSLGPHALGEEPAASPPQSHSSSSVPSIVAFDVLDPSIGPILQLPNVPGATSFIVQEPDMGAVQLPATQKIYMFAIPDSFEQLFRNTKAVIAPEPVLVVALEGKRELARFSLNLPCPPVAFIAARGSGQNLLTETYKFGLGSRGSGVINELRRLLKAKSHTLPAIAVDYPAVAVGVGPGWQIEPGNIPGIYRSSVEIGVWAAESAIDRSIRACPKTRLILFGYSQGAQVMGDAFAELPEFERNHIARLILFADATYRPKDPRVSYKPKPLPEHGIKGTRAPFPSGDTAIIESWCFELDFVCQYGLKSRSLHGKVYDTYEVHAAEAMAGTLFPKLR
jgi:hypothetical protein